MSGAVNQTVDPATGEPRVVFKRDLHTTDSNGQAIVDGPAKVRRAEEIAAKQMELARLHQEEAMSMVAAAAGNPASAETYAELKAQIADLQKKLSAPKTLPAETAVAAPAAQQVNETNSNSAKMEDDAEYLKYAAYAKRLEEEKAAAAKVAQEAANSAAQRKAELDALVKERLEEALKAMQPAAAAAATTSAQKTAGSKRTASSVEEEDDAFIDSLNADGAAGGSSNEDTEEINRKFKEFTDKYDKLKKDKESFERSKYRLSRAQQESGQQTLAARTAEMKNLEGGLLSFVASKFEAFKKVKDATVAADYDETIADIKSESDVDIRGLRHLKSQVVMAAASASRANQAARTLQDLEDQMKSAKREVALAQMRANGHKLDAEASKTAQSLDPANRKSTSALTPPANANEANAAQRTGTVLFPMALAKQESLDEAEQAFGKPSFLAYATASNFEAVASSRPSIKDKVKKNAENAEYAWVRRYQSMDNVPPTFEHEGRTYETSFSHDADAGALFSTPPTPMAGLMHSENATQREIGKTLIAIRDSMSGSKGRLPVVTPLQYYGSLNAVAAASRSAQNAAAMV